MWRYRHPGFALHLLHELQKQQRNGLQCDTLLQTGGVSVPAHSCVLSALSPIFSRAFTNSSSLPAGHSRLVNFQAVHARALLKLVGFLYSGEMEGEGPGEQEEVIDIAHRLGFSDLIDGLKEHMNGQQDKGVRCQEIGLQTEDTEREKRYADVQMLVRRESVTHAETQTDGPYAYFADACPILESEPCLTRPDNLVSVPSEYTTSSSAIGLQSKKNIASSSNVSKALNPVCSQCFQQIQEKHKRRKIPQNIGQVRKICERQKLNVDESNLLNSSVLERVKEVGGKDFRKLVEKLGFRSGSAFKQQEGTQISLKIKLKRRRNGAPWEIVSVQEESRADGSSASGRGHASPGQTQSHSEDDFTLAQHLRNCPEVLLSPSPTVHHQDLATVTLTPPSDLTMSPPATPAKNASGKSGSHNHETVPHSSHIQMPPASPVPMDRNSNLHHQNEKHESPEPHLGPEMDECDTVDTASTPCFCLRGTNLGPGGPVVSKMPPLTGSSAQRKAGPESPGCEKQSKLETTELKKVATTASDQSLLDITSPCATSQKDVDPSLMLPCTASEKVLLSNLPFGTGGIEMPHQNVAELKHVLDNLFWTADNFVQSVKQTKSETSEGHHWNLQTSGAGTSSAAQDAPDRVSTLLQTASDTASSAAGKQCLEAVIWRDPKVLPAHLPHITHKVTGSVDGTDLNEMRLPRCLSPLVSEEGETDGFTPECLSQVTVSSLSTSSLTLKPALKYRISSRQPQSLPGKTGQQNQTNTHRYVTQKASSSSHSSELSSCSSRSVNGHMEETSEGILGQVMTQSLENQIFGGSKDKELDRQIGASEVKRKSTKRHRVEAMISGANMKKCKMFDGDSEGVDTQTVMIMTPSSGNGEAVEDFSTTQFGDYPCSRKIYWLRAGNTVSHISKDQKSMIKLTEFQTNDSIKIKDEDKCTNKDKIEPGLSVAKRGRGRPPKKRNHVADFVQNLSKEKTLNSLSVDTRVSTCAGKDEFLSKRSKTNSGCVQNECVGCVGPESPGCERQSKLETTELKKVATTASDQSLLDITSPCATSQKDVDPSLMLPCTASEKVLLSNLPFGTGGIEMPHQNVAELKHVLDNLFWTADNFVQSVKQTKSETSEGHHWNLQTSGAGTSSAAQDAPDRVSTLLQTASDTASSAAGKQCLETVIWREPKVLPTHLPHITHKVTGSVDGTDLNKMRLPRCLSPLVSEEGETDGFTPERLSQVTVSSLSTSSLTLKPALKYRISSRQPQSLPGKTGQQNQTNTHRYVTQKASSSSHSSELSSCSSRSVNGHMEETSEGILEQVMTQSLENQIFGGSKDKELDRRIGTSEVKRKSTKRHRVEAMISGANMKKCKMFDGDSEGVDTQTVMIMTPSSGNGEAVEDFSTTQFGDYPCSRKIYWLRAGNTVSHISKDQKSMIKLTEFQTNDSIKIKDEDKCTNKDKIEPGLSVAKRGRGRPPKKRNHVADFVQNLSKEKTLNSLSVDTRVSTCAGKDEFLSKRSKTNSGCVQNEGHDLVKDKEQDVCLVAKRGCRRPTKGKKRADNEHQNLQKAESKMTSGCEGNKVQGPEMPNASVEFEEVNADMNLNKEEAKQPNVNASQAKKTSIVDQVFHQTIFSFGTSVTGHFAPIGQQISASLLNTENSEKTKRNMITGPPLPEIIKKFRQLTDRDHVRGRKLMIVDNEREEKESPGKGKIETRVEVNYKAGEVKDESTDKNVDSKNTNDHLKMPSKTRNGLTENSETEMGRNQADEISDIGITSVHSDLSCLKSHLYPVPLASKCDSNCDMVCDPQSTSTKILENIEVTLDRTEDFHHKKTANTHIVHREANQVWNDEKVKGNTEMVGVHMVEIPSKNDKPHGAEINDVEVEIMEESAPDAAGHREQAGTSCCTAEKTDVEQSLSSFDMTNGESGTYEEEPGELQLLRSDVAVMSSDEGTKSSPVTGETFQVNGNATTLTNTNLQAVTVKEALSVQLEEKPVQTDLSSTFNSKDLSALILVGVNFENEAQDCDEDEEVVVDDVLSYPGILPHSSSVREPVTVLMEEGDESEEEEVDVTGEDTN